MLVSISTRTAVGHNVLFDHIILILKSLLSLMHRAVLWLCSLENVSDRGGRKKRAGVRQDVDSIFWEAYEATRGKTLVG